MHETLQPTEGAEWMWDVAEGWAVTKSDTIAKFSYSKTLSRLEHDRGVFHTA